MYAVCVCVRKGIKTNGKKKKSRNPLKRGCFSPYLLKERIEKKIEYFI